MFLAVDIGNSRTKFGVFDGETLIAKISIPTIPDISSDALMKTVGDGLAAPISQAIISSVVTEVNSAVRLFIQTKFSIEPIFVNNDLDFGITINYQPLEDAGADRLVNAFSAVEKYGAPCIVCSFGTALTIDVVSADRVLTGGVIAPGMNTLAAALKLTTSRLPEVEIEKPDTVIQTNTVGCIQSGIVYGYFGLVDGLLTRLKKEVGDNPSVIATGGFAALVAENIEQIDMVDSGLMLDGLRRLFNRITAM